MHSRYSGPAGNISCHSAVFCFCFLSFFFSFCLVLSFEVLLDVRIWSGRCFAGGWLVIVCVRVVA